MEDIQKACPEFTEDLYNRYCGDRQREGDYVLYYLSNNGIDCLNQFFMLTANKDELTEKETLEDLISVKKFKKDIKSMSVKIVRAKQKEKISNFRKRTVNLYLKFPVF